MHELTEPRTEPYVWATWLTKPPAGEAACLRSLWFRAHYNAVRVATDFDAAAWQVEHAALLRKAAAEYDAEGYTVFVENQNRFTLRGRTGTLAGKPAIVAVKKAEGVGWVIDTKTGLPKASDRAQVMLYMWALRRNPAYAGVRLSGRVQYKARYNLIAPEEVDVLFSARVAEMMKEVCGDAEPRKAPNFKECEFCPLTSEDCPDRVESEVVYAGVTEEF